MEQEIRDAVGPGDAEFVDATTLATGADGRLDRDQPVHGRLRVAAGPGAAVARRRSCARSSSTAPRSSRTSTRFNWGRLAARRPARVEARRRARARRQPAIAARCPQIARRDDRAPRRRSSPTTRTPPTRSATPTSSRACARPRREGRRARPTLDRGRRALLLQADRRQGRVRGRAPVRGDRFPRSASPRSSRATTSSHFHLAPPLANKPDADDRRARKVAVRPVDVDGVPRAGEAARACAARRSTSSATPPSARWSAS